MGNALLVTWHSGGNPPPLLAAASLLAKVDYTVTVLASEATVGEALAAGFEAVGYRRAPAPPTHVAFEAVAKDVMAAAAGRPIAADVVEALEQLRPDIAVADCMLPAALAACASTRTPCVSLVHFAYGHARLQMVHGAGAWTTDRPQLDATRRALGLAPTESDLGAWESTDLLLVTTPRWFDAASSALPPNVVHAGPLGVNLPAGEPPRRQRPLVLLAFSTTVIEGQEPLVQRTCDAIASLPVDALLTLGPSIDASELRLPTNVTAVAHVDHDRVLPETSAVVTHGGLGTTLRALAHGIPLVLAPLARDQHFNARRVCTFGAGLQLDAEAATSELRSAVESVLGDGRFAEAAKEAARRIVSDQPERMATDAMQRLAAARRAEGA